jgi:hypothetical protein
MGEIVSSPVNGASVFSMTMTTSEEYFPPPFPSGVPNETVRLGCNLLRSVVRSRLEQGRHFLPLSVFTVQYSRPNRTIVSSFTGIEDVKILEGCSILGDVHYPSNKARCVQQAGA